MAREIEEERRGARCIALAADVRDIKAMEEAVDATIKEFGRIDFVIAGAAGNFLASIDVPPLPGASLSFGPRANDWTELELQWVQDRH
jgi:NAD(P)-dependent dehydrogenase (short-subunit alcohol dehydrogenase family)